MQSLCSQGNGLEPGVECTATTWARNWNCLENDSEQSSSGHYDMYELRYIRRKEAMPGTVWLHYAS